MADVVISPDMNLPVPIVGQDPGPDWANNINACLSAIDSHNHTAGQGVLITPLAMNINTDFSMNTNNVIDVRATRYTSLGTAPALPADLNETAVILGDLYFIDGSGNLVRLTQGGAPAGATGTITGLPSGTASASFAGTTFTFQSATATPASLAVGPTTIAQAIASGFGVTISASGAQAANYNLTLPPALPASSGLVTVDASGNLSYQTYAPQTYTPTFTTGSNTNSVTFNKAFVTRVGNIVSVQGSVDVATAGPGNTVIRGTLPIASNFATSFDLSGQGSAENANIIAQIYAEPTNDVSELLFVSGAATSYSFFYSYSYEIV